MEWLFGLGAYTAALVKTVFGWLSAAGIVLRISNWLIKAPKDPPWRRLLPWIDRGIAVCLVLAAYQLARNQNRDNERLVRQGRDSTRVVQAELDSSRRGSAARRERANTDRWRAEHPTFIGCAEVSNSFPTGEDSLAIEVRGAPVVNVSVESLVFFEALPVKRPARRAWVPILLAHYYGTLQSGNFEGSTRRVYGTQGNRQLHEALTRTVVDSLSAHSLTWAGIELSTAVHVRYRDELGGTFDRYFSRQVFEGELTPTGGSSWATRLRTADSLRVHGQFIDVRAPDPTSASQVATRCVRSVE